MRETLPKLLIVVLLAVIVGLPIVLRPAEDRQAAKDDTPHLIIYTPHNEQIRYEVEQAFNDYRAASNLSRVVFDWRAPGGTSDIRKSILSQYNALIASGKGLDSGIGVDLFFGGGEYDHGKIAEGLKASSGISKDLKLRIVMDPELSPELFQAVFPEPLIGGERLYRRYRFDEVGEDGSSTTVDILGWTGVTLSSFGIAYNTDTLKQLGLKKPTTWGDLTHPRLRGWLALADPGHSGSITATYNAALRRQGWTEGWDTLRMMFANARYFTSDATRVPIDVSRGDAAAGLCIDFYGRYQAGVVGQGRVGYIDPVEQGQSMTATTADPITLLRGAPDAELARQFIAWLLTPDAQGLWQRSIDPADQEHARPKRYELRRQPIRRDLYTPSEQSRWVDVELDPYTTAVPLPDGTPDYFGLVAPVTRAMAIDAREDLVSAWSTLVRARESHHPRLAEMEHLFFAMPMELTLVWPDTELAEHWRAIHYDPLHPRHGEVVNILSAFSHHLKSLGDMDTRRVQWRAFFQNNYRAVVDLGEGS